MIHIKLDMVNKKQYEESEIYKEIKILIPRSVEELKEDFKYLDLDYMNLTIKDTHILKCEFIDRDNKVFCENITKEINNLIIEASKEGYTTPFQDIKKFHNVIKEFSSHEIHKLLAVMEVKKQEIHNIHDVIKFAQNIDSFSLTEAYSNEEFAKALIYNYKIDIEDLMNYSDLNKLGKEYSEFFNINNTKYGFLKQECNLKETFLQKEQKQDTSNIEQDIEELE